MQSQLIKEYRSVFGLDAAIREFQKDAKKLAREGFKVVSAVPTQHNGLFIHKQGLVVVVYEKE